MRAASSRRRARGRGPLAALLAAALFALLAPGAAAAATVVNGDFERGSLQGWKVHRATGAPNDWFAYKGTEAPIADERRQVAPLPPPQGVYAAIADELIADTLILYQDVALEPGVGHQLNLFAYFSSGKPLIAAETLSAEVANQQFRIDVVRPGAPLESLDPADVLSTVFRTPTTPKPKKEATPRMAPTRFSADLSPFAGQTVRLRIAVVATEEVLNAGVDAISIDPPGADPLAPKRFGLGRARANRRNGTVALRVTVPGPGLLTVKAGNAIRKVSRRAAGAGELTLRLRPRPVARRILRRDGRVRVRVGVDFEPAVGARQTAIRVLAFQES